MSQNSQERCSIAENTVDIELKPQAAAQTTAASEVHNGMAEADCPEAGTDNDPTFSIRTPGQGDAMPIWDTGSAGQSGQRLSHEHSVLHETAKDTIPLEGSTLLFEIGETVISRLRTIREKADGKRPNSHEPERTYFWFKDSIDEAVEFLWGVGKQFERGGGFSMDCRVREAWPEDQIVSGVCEYIVGADGFNFETKAPCLSRWILSNPQYDVKWRDWCHAAENRSQSDDSPTVSEASYDVVRDGFKGRIIYCTWDRNRKGFQYFPISLLASALSFEEPFVIHRSRYEPLDVGYSASFLSKDFRGGYNMHSNHYSHHTIHWQIRYFSPLDFAPYDVIEHLSSKRQTATIRQGSEQICLQEKRVRISFRVLKKAPELFSMLVLADEHNVCTYGAGNAFDFSRLWSRYGFHESAGIDPTTYYLFEICRVFKICMDAWGKTVDAIDELVHVKLDDFDNDLRVEDLMFDKSFQRSKDYFVALQLLRIIDEWLEEVQTSVSDMLKDPILERRSMLMEVSRDSCKAAVRYVEDHATAVQSRVLKKQEEIKSLRDGLFNATSLRESTKAMALNQAIYVFTVVTVLFTPISFLATFWALPFLNNPTEGTDIVPVPAAFRNSFIIMPILTYALVIGVAWFVGQRNSVKAVLSILRELLKSAGRLLRSGWNLLRKKEKKRHGRSPSP